MNLQKLIKDKDTELICIPNINYYKYITNIDNLYIYIYMYIYIHTQ